MVQNGEEEDEDPLTSLSKDTSDHTDGAVSVKKRRKKAKTLKQKRLSQTGSQKATKKSSDGGQVFFMDTTPSNGGCTPPILPSSNRGRSLRKTPNSEGEQVKVWLLFTCALLQELDIISRSCIRQICSTFYNHNKLFIVRIQCIITGEDSKVMPPTFPHTHFFGQDLLEQGQNTLIEQSCSINSLQTEVGYLSKYTTCMISELLK